MANFYYRGIDYEGKEQSGSLDAESAQTAQQKLAPTFLQITQLKEQRSSFSWRKQTVTKQQLLYVTLQLSFLLRAQMPLHESMQNIETQVQKQSIHPIIAHISHHVQSGRKLSEAMEQYPEVLSGIYCSMVRAGEMTGSLPTLLKHLAALLTNQLKLQKQLSSALIYPAILLIFCIGNIAVMLTITIPAVEELLAAKSLNITTRALITTSHLLRKQWDLLLIGLGTFVFALYQFWRRSNAYYSLAISALKLPLLGSAILHAVLIHWMRTLALLLQGNVTLVESLQVAKKTLPPFLWQQQIDHLIQQVTAGKSLSCELQKLPLLPTHITAMIATGEKTGNLAEVLHSIADLHEYQLQRDLKKLQVLLPTVLLLAMGMLIGFVIWSLMQPLTSFEGLF